MSRLSARTRTDHHLQVLTAKAELRRGDMLAGRYVIRAQLGAGAVGRVFRAYDRATKTTVAVKVVRPELTGHRSALERLGREVRHARDVQHPNVCRVFELHESDGFTYFAMELARTSLRAAIHKAARRPVAQRMADAKAVTAGLAAVHAAGIVHRDLKPENILRMADGRLVVSDFGVAGYHRGPRLSRAGTDGYVAPEIIKGRAATPRSDLWSLGVVLHEILFGKRPGPAQGDSPIDAALSDLCLTCTAAVPARRPPSAAAVLERLEELDGETLHERLRRGRIPLGDSLKIASQVLEALTDLHQRGGVHGAVTPANIFIRRSDGTVRLLVPDADPLASATASPVYLAPEQARRELDIDSRADIFAVGCVLLECIKGRHPDARRPVNVVLAHRSMGEGLSTAVDRVHSLVRPLLRKLLSTGRVQRPKEAGPLAAQLAELADVVRTRGRSRPKPDTLACEQVMGSVIAVRVSEPRAISQGMRLVAESVGATAARVGPDMLAATFHGAGTPADLASRAARCALELRATLPAAALGVSTGRIRLGTGVPDGEATERATALLRDTQGGDIHLDQTSARLLAPRFRIRDSRHPLLLGEDSLVDRPRTVLGKEIPCVGRDRELRTLIGLWEECTSEPVARTVLVTAPAGTGKSRIRHELLDRIQFGDDAFTLLVGTGDALRAGAPFAMLAPALRAAAGLVGGELPTIAQKRLLAHVSRHVPADKARRVAAFTGEIADVPFPDDDLPALRAARQDPRLMSDQTLAAWLDYLEAECSAHPVLLVLEDLHWGDAPSVQFVDAALRTLREKPLMVLAFARPEVDDKFPNLWIERDLQRISLPPLTPRSAQKLLKAALPDMTVDQAAWIVERADGNPFYLEELIRAVAGGAGTQTLPGTVIGMVQARFDALGGDAKRVLQAAAVFGQTFRPAGVRHLLGGDHDRSLDQWLDILVQKEVLFSRQAADTRELVFRHALMQEAAYDMLTADDRVLGHRLAGEHLESVGEREAILLVEHYERGGELKKAAHWCRFAAEQALDANDLSEVIKRVQRGISLGAAGEVLTALSLSEAQARFWRGEYQIAEERARQVVASEQSKLRYDGIRELVSALGQQTKFDEVQNWTESVYDVGGGSDPEARTNCLLRAAGYLIAGGRRELAERILFEAESEGRADPAAQVRILDLRGKLAIAAGEQGVAIGKFEAALASLQQSGSLRGITEMLANVGFTLCDLGAFERAEERLSAALANAERMNLGHLTVVVLINLALVRAHSGHLEEAATTALRAVSLALEQGDSRLLGVAEGYLSMIALRRGDPQAAESHAQRAVAAFEQVPPFQPFGRATLARALLLQNRVAQALAVAMEANQQMESLGSAEDGEALVRLTLAECFLASGDRSSAAQAIRTAQARLNKRAAQINDPALREKFLDRIPEHRRTQELAAQL